MESSKILETFKGLGLEINQVLENDTNGLTIRASKTYNTIFGKKKIGCSVEFEFSLNANADLSNLSRRIIDVKPLIPQLDAKDIDDLKTKAIQSLQSKSAFSITLFKISNNELNINAGDGFFEDGGLGLDKYEILVIINLMRAMEQRIMIKMEKLMKQKPETNAQKEEEDDELLGVKDVSELLGLAINTIHKKASKKVLPHMKRGKNLYFKRSEILEYLNRGKVLSNDEIEELARKKLKGK
jgi:hypothetical protein